MKSNGKKIQYVSFRDTLIISANKRSINEKLRFFGNIWGKKNKRNICGLSQAE